ncbi:trypsin-like serine protease [Vibrio tubiashii]|uniref:Serine protease n=1 Tax=Vibrio tubiashii ATCC 19109 TaxID=1051646 RepID=F9T6S7_9VIBR|nr:trypsin-like serine protease [Vibrio tubiashii]AIW17491.1 trypsin [Vibrio tubiashii ATCC 19109]EGU54482.1 trypsin protease precursor [Vibrio tubiashii ATCC 19109]EIF05995.1 trypsin protease precursor [Vibrio tubiashii NCIMB 1337 = ATCC 19106]
MNVKLSAISLAIALTTSFQANAIINGTSENKANFQQYVEMGCTGNIIGGKWVLTAAHCATNLGMRDVVRYDGSIAKTKAQHNHPAFDGTLSDIGFWELESIQEVNQINTISVSNVGAGETITVYGFGGTAPNLNKAIQTSEAVSGNAQWLRTVDISQGSSTGGDSGASYLNSLGQIVAVHGGGSSTSSNGMEGYRTETGRSFILDTVNGWHYPTRLSVSNSATITVQSLHVGGTTDAAYTNGDLTINYAASTCDDGAIGEFATCTYSVTTNGGHGQLFLSANEKVEINKPVSTTDGNSTTSGGGGGGSFGFASILALLGLGIRRYKASPNA